MRDVCSLICLALIGLFRSRASLQAEILTLRHQLNLLRRKSPQRLTFISIDRLVFAGLYRLAPSVPSRRRLFSRPRGSRPLPIAATFSSLAILACHEAGITVTLPKPQTSGTKSDGRFGKQDFVYLPEEDAYRCPAGEQLPYRFTSEEDGGATGPQPVKIVRLNRSARQGQSGGFHDGSMSICSKLCSSALMQIDKPCASVARQSSIPSAP